MISVGYTREFAAGVICNAGTLGILIPPSIVMVVYAAATDVSVGRMFLAGVFPGLLAGLMLGVTKALLLQPGGLLILVTAVTGMFLIYWIIDPKLRAVSREYESQQAGYVAELEQRLRWQDGEDA